MDVKKLFVKKLKEDRELKKFCGIV